MNYFRAQESDDLDEDKQGSRGTCTLRSVLKIVNMINCNDEQ